MLWKEWTEDDEDGGSAYMPAFAPACESLTASRREVRPIVKHGLVHVKLYSLAL